ncbi:MAG: glycosyltransferase family 39 protein [Cytophagales bacterium]|nr:glycosyltransferase family 39 protein [Cytophagales bacterium]
MAKNSKQSPQAKQPASPQATTATPSSFTFDIHFIAFIVCLLVVAFVRFRLVSIPFERDEGEYAYIGNLILQGIPPYANAYNMKLPGTYFMYALIQLIFGETVDGVHLGLLIMSLASMTFLYFIGKNVYNATVGVVASGAFGLMAVSYSVLGFAAHATHFVTFFALLGLFLFTLWQKSQKFWLSPLIGIAMGMAFLMKQQAVFFLIFGGCIILIHYFTTKPLNIISLIINTLLYSIGVFVPYLVTVGIMYQAGVFDKFWFWTFEYAQKYASGVSFEDGKMLFNMTWKPMFDEFFMVWIIGMAAVVLLFIKKHTPFQIALALGFAIFAFATVCPGFYFRQHYFIPLFPAVALLFALGLDFVVKLIGEKVKIVGALPYVLLILVSSNAIAKGKNYYLKTRPVQLCKMIYGSNPFVESLEIARYIQQNSNENDKIAVLGSEPQLFFYADRKSATGYIYTYGLMEIHDYNTRMQNEMIAEIEKEKPKYMVFARVGTSWLTRPGSPTIIFDWFNKYSQENYRLCGVADMVGMNTNYVWDDQALTYQPQGQELVLIYVRKN